MAQETETKKPSQNAIKEDPGLAYVKRPFSLGFEKEKELLEEAREKLRLLVELESESNEEWSSRVTYGGVKVTTKKDGAFCTSKGVCDVPEGITIADFWTQFKSDFRNNEAVDKLFKRIDPMVLHMTIVAELEHKELLDESKHEQLLLLYGVLYLAPLVSDRDVIFIQHSCETKCPVTGDDVFVSNCFSVDLPELAPDQKKDTGRVRCILERTAYVFRPHPTLGEGRLQMSFQVDPRGYLPTSVVNLASVSQALNCGRVRDIYAQYAVVKKEMNSEVAFPFASYHLARRGGTAFHGVSLVAPEEGAATFFVRLRAHAEHSITVQLEQTDEPFTVAAVKKDPVGVDLAAGNAVSFGGKNLLDAVLEVTLQGGSNDAAPMLSLQFTNPNWKKAYVCLPVDVSTSVLEPTSLEDSTATAPKH